MICRWQVLYHHATSDWTSFACQLYTRGGTVYSIQRSNATRLYLLVLPKELSACKHSDMCGCSIAQTALDGLPQNMPSYSLWTCFLYCWLIFTYVYRIKCAKVPSCCISLQDSFWSVVHLVNQGANPPLAFLDSTNYCAPGAAEALVFAQSRPKPRNFPSFDVKPCLDQLNWPCDRGKAPVGEPRDTAHMD